MFGGVDIAGVSGSKGLASMFRGAIVKLIHRGSRGRPTDQQEQRSLGGRFGTGYVTYISVLAEAEGAVHEVVLIIASPLPWCASEVRHLLRLDAEHDDGLLLSVRCKDNGLFRGPSLVMAVRS